MYENIGSFLAAAMYIMMKRKEIWLKFPSLHLVKIKLIKLRWNADVKGNTTPSSVALHSHHLALSVTINLPSFSGLFKYTFTGLCTV